MKVTATAMVCSRMAASSRRPIYCIVRELDMMTDSARQKLQLRFLFCAYEEKKHYSEEEERNTHSFALCVCKTRFFFSKAKLKQLYSQDHQPEKKTIQKSLKDLFCDYLLIEISFHS